MKFKAKVDKYYVNLIAIIIAILALSLLFPLFFEESNSLPVIIILGSVFIVSVLLILWSSFTISYTFNEDHLFVKGGLFQSKIPYKRVTKVAWTNEIFWGYRMMSAKEGIEIFYKASFFGSVKISPREQDAFIEELVKRCPHMEVQK